MKNTKILTLSDNKEYVVLKDITVNGKEYMYLGDIENPNIIKYCIREKDELIEIIDKEIINKMIELYGLN